MPRRRYYPGPGVRFGNRVVLRMTSHGKDGESRVEVRCDCGALDRVSVSRLTRRQMDRCTSCAAKKRTEEKMRRETLVVSPEYKRLELHLVESCHVLPWTRPTSGSLNQQLARRARRAEGSSMTKATEIPDTPCGRAFQVVLRRLQRDEVAMTNEDITGGWEWFQQGWGAGLYNAVFGEAA